MAALTTVYHLRLETSPGLKKAVYQHTRVCVRVCVSSVAIPSQPLQNCDLSLFPHIRLVRSGTAFQLLRIVDSSEAVPPWVQD